ncbi:hypothetical protein OIV83_003209 [Microbotryomycetes sp. JL201]|nr:hypothetical protein OIV83_003209 [Microbotryomycetes sp. JL201]
MRTTTLALAALAGAVGAVYGNAVSPPYEHARRHGDFAAAAIKRRQNAEATHTTARRAAVAARASFTRTSSAAAAKQTKASAAAAAAATAKADTPKRLIEYKFDYKDIPYKVNPFAVERGPQSGYNICNSTTAGPDSQCQTAIINSMSDLCLWGAGGNHTNAALGDVEGGVVAYCLSPVRGGRQLPPSALKGMQMVKTEKYIQIVGKIDLTAIGFSAKDDGGELDPQGADGLGNPVGGLVYSDALFAGTGLEQVRRWNLFYDSGMFCLKICNLQRNDPNYCLNTYDTLACRYNMPSSFYDDETRQDKFVECESDLQDVVGEYKQKNGATATWSLPRPLPPDATLPYTPRVPSSSNCKTYSKSELFAQATVASLATATTEPTSGTLPTAKPASLGSSTSPATARVGSSGTLKSSGLGAAAATTSARSAANRVGSISGLGVAALLALALVA